MLNPKHFIRGRCWNNEVNIMELSTIASNYYKPLINVGKFSMLDVAKFLPESSSGNIGKPKNKISNISNKVNKKSTQIKQTK